MTKSQISICAPLNLNVLQILRHFYLRRFFDIFKPLLENRLWSFIKIAREAKKKFLIEFYLIFFVFYQGFKSIKNKKKNFWPP